MRNLALMLAMIRSAILNRNSFAILAFASAFYLMFYAWPYANQLIIEIPTAVVDMDRSEKSRDWIETIDATPAAKVISTSSSLDIAKAQFVRGEVDVIVVLPQNLQRDTMRGMPTSITVFGNGAYPVKARAVGSAVTLIAAQENAKLTATQLVRHGLDPVKTKVMSILPPSFVSQDLFNPISGYGLYTVSVVATIILQGIMLFGTTIVVGGWLNDWRRDPFIQAIVKEPTKLFVLIAAFWSIGLFWGFFVEGLGLSVLDMPTFLDPVATALSIAFFTLAIVCLAVMLALLMGSNHYAATLCVIASAPCVFLTGLIFPFDNAAPWVVALAQLIPTTPGANAVIAASQEGAGVREILPYLGVLTAQIVGYGTVAMMLLKKYRN
ncbi:MAG: ABC transporter permease [Burkholderiaceae bacterium]|nr:ABC transporter permease [Burkholderiaceae bacterium]